MITIGLAVLEMMGNGYFSRYFGGEDTSAGKSEDIVMDSDGNIIYSPIDPIFIDENSEVYFNTENKNAKIYTENNEIYVERVI